MSTLVLVLSALAAQTAEAKPADSLASRWQEAASPAVPFHQYQQQISELLKREAQAKDPAARAAAVRAMCELHARIVADPRYETSDTLKQYRARLWSRLTRVKADLKRQLARSGGEQQTLDDLALLEQADPLAVAAADSLAQSLSLLDQAQGGPGLLLAYGRGGGPVPDNGRELVELIERTINPAFWDVNGGPGTIRYYRPLMCLVVRASAEVHGNVGGVLGGLREAGR